MVMKVLASFSIAPHSGAGGKGFYVDDRTIRPDEFLKYSVGELDQLCTNSRKDSK